MRYTHSIYMRIKFPNIEVKLQKLASKHFAGRDPAQSVISSFLVIHGHLALIQTF